MAFQNHSDISGNLRPVSLARPNFGQTPQSESRLLNTRTRIEVVVPSAASGSVVCGIHLPHKAIGLPQAAVMSAACLPKSGKGHQAGLARSIAYLREPEFNAPTPVGSPRGYAAPLSGVSA